jgi:hypothetical protein
LLLLTPSRGKLYVADRSNKLVQIFTPEGDFIGQ